ncbi:LLM class flavin-dependent oxidoreductase [Kitasatospora viridis]|uniref:Luciferase family oxidoreductase group 1 n=1 Tax=Kitasatospora viridis TaxID=281105 RepID=A0A561UC99_9ACTN|nr:LLM class flavin-dependent oxidoreductase [Kitasatospora viridis]TWF96983.1 luciferase family oxidoreductase group 1 [Kitasatospora viridis]
MPPPTRVPLSVLDTGPVERGETPGRALARTISLARQADRLGLARFWVAEHHGAPNIATSSPAVLLAAIGAATRRIRLGSGGVMLPNHPPFTVAEQFGTLDALHPGRIDLGIGRAPGTDPRTAAALRRLPVDRFPEELADLLGFLGGGFPAGHPFEEVTAVPGRRLGAGAVWLLGTNTASARTAARLGLPFAYAHHLKPGSARAAFDAYRGEFRPSAHLAEPHTMLSVQVVCADDDAQAARLCDPLELCMLRARSAPIAPYPSAEEARAHRWTAQEREWADQHQAAQAVGSPESVGQRLAELLVDTEADELMMVSMLTDTAAKLRSLLLVRQVLSRPAHEWF